MRLTGENIRIDRRYRGPESSGNGGYSAGALAERLGEAAEVTLRLPPPLERPLAVVERGDGLALMDGDAVVAEAKPAAGPIEAIGPVSWREAVEAATRYEPFGPETFRGCFSCGLARDEGDGLRIYPGAVAGRERVVAAPWVAHEPSVPVVWAAIDCAGAYATSAHGRGETVLGRMAARIDRLPREGERCVVAGWAGEEDGRKLAAGTALWTEAGELLAVSRQTWIAPKT